MRRSVNPGGARFGVALVLLVGMMLLPAVASAAETEITIHGGGWGHGVGMSQYGAQGQAVDGIGAHDIVKHYYTGTDVELLSAVVDASSFLLTAEQPLWIGLFESVEAFTFVVVDAELELCQEGDADDCPRPTRPKPGETWTFEALPEGGCQFFLDGVAQDSPGDCAASITLPPGAIAELPELAHSWVAPGEDRSFANGTLQIRPVGLAPAEGDDLAAWLAGPAFHVAVALDVEEYVRGIGEMPSDWEPAALQAQALAARSYGVSKALARETGDRATTYLGDPALSSTRASDCWCHLRATPVDQNYVGLLQAQLDTWSDAVDATAGEVITHPDDGFTESGVISAFYSSSTAGVTESNMDGFGSVVQYPYLLSVDDGWSAEDTNPNATWTATVTDGEVAAALGFDILTSAKHVSGPPASTVEFVGLIGDDVVTVTKPGWWMKSVFGLKSPQVTSFEYERLLPVVDAGPDVVTHLAGDFNGDGLADVAVLDLAEGQWEVGLAGQSGFAVADWADLPHPDGWTTSSVGDFDGDGRDDIVSFHKPEGDWWVSRSTGSGFTTSVWTVFTTRTGWEAHVSGDFDGDGLDDMANFKDGRWYVSRSTGSGFTTSRWTDFSTRSGWAAHLAGDFDGDGLDDIANFKDGRWWISRSTGATFVTDMWSEFSTLTGWEAHLAGDFDGDGLDDIGNFKDGRWWISRSTGATFVTDKWSEFTTLSGWAAHVAGDFNGDGSDDIANFKGGRWWVSVSQGTTFSTSMWSEIDPGSWVHVQTEVDDDGLDDIISLPEESLSIVLYRSTGNGFEVTIE